MEVDIRELKLETEKPVSSIKAVIVDRFMKKETEKQYVPYCGIIYPFGDSKKQLFFTEQAIHTVIHYGYTDRQEDAYVALIKREIIKKDIVPTVLRRQKMTKSECYSQISTCNAGIEEDQKRSGNGKKKIDLYENTNRRLERGQENMADFCSCHSRKIRQTRDYFPQVKYVEGYVQDMTEYLQGAEYNSVNGKFDGAIATINRKKQKPYRK